MVSIRIRKGRGRWRPGWRRRSPRRFDPNTDRPRARSMIRLFAAVAVPEEIGEALQRRQQGVPGARWRPLEALHVTLRFFGEVREDVADDLDAELSTVTGAPFELMLEGVGSFGDGEDIHAVWAGVAESPALRQLAARC